MGVQTILDQEILTVVGNFQPVTGDDVCQQLLEHQGIYPPELWDGEPVVDIFRRAILDIKRAWPYPSIDHLVDRGLLTCRWEQVATIEDGSAVGNYFYRRTALCIPLQPERKKRALVTNSDFMPQPL